MRMYLCKQVLAVLYGARSIQSIIPKPLGDWCRAIRKRTVRKVPGSHTLGLFFFLMGFDAFCKFGGFMM